DAFQDPNRAAYLRSVVRHAQGRTEPVHDAWQSSYYDEFLSRDGTSAGSSTSLLLNAMSKSYEELKNFKVGLPVGKRPGQTAAEPTLVEAYWSGRSLPFAERHLQAVVLAWRGGASDHADAPGFDDYLLTVPGGSVTVAETEAQIAEVERALSAIQVPFSTLLTNDPATADALHTEMQKLTRYFKSELFSRLGISITYQSGDGD
ncbi:MAG: imelysin family protein, partial [Catalinimonas sp.]